MILINVEAKNKNKPAETKINWKCFHFHLTTYGFLKSVVTDFNIPGMLTTQKLQKQSYCSYFTSFCSLDIWAAHQENRLRATFKMRKMHSNFGNIENAKTFECGDIIMLFWSCFTRNYVHFHGRLLVLQHHNPIIFEKIMNKKFSNFKYFHLPSCVVLQRMTE